MLASNNAMDSKEALRQTTICLNQMKEEVEEMEMSGEREGKGRRESRGCYLGPRCGNVLTFLSLTHTYRFQGGKKQRHSSDTVFKR